MSRTGSRWALVTGASKGIGAATATALAAAGHDVVVHYGSDKEGAEAVAARCAEHGVDTRVVGADLATDLETLTAVVDELGGVGVLVNNAGRTADSLSLSMSDDAFRDVLEVNLTAAFRLSRAVLRGMLRARGRL